MSITPVVSAALAAALLLAGCASSGESVVSDPHESDGRPDGAGTTSDNSGSRSDFLVLYQRSLEGGARVDFSYERSVDGEVVLSGTETAMTLDDTHVVVGISGLTYWSGDRKISCSDFDGERQCLAPESVDTLAERSARLLERITERTGETGDLVVTEIESLDVLGVSTRCFEVRTVEVAGTVGNREVFRTETCFDPDAVVLARLSERQGIIDSWVATSKAPATAGEISEVLSGYPLETVIGSPESGPLPELT